MHRDVAECLGLVRCASTSMAKVRRVRDMQDELQAFLEAPTARTYRQVREALLEEVAATCSAETLSAGVLVELTELAAADQFHAVLGRIDDLQPAWALSPRIHYLAAVAADEVGEDDVAELERFVFQSCLDGILATGDGTKQSPYLSTYSSDVHDLLLALGLEPRSQRLVEQRGLLCDVVRCADDEEVWFELTRVLHDPRQRAAEFAALPGLRQ